MVHRGAAGMRGGLRGRSGRWVAAAVLVSFLSVHVFPRSLSAATDTLPAPSAAQRAAAVAQAAEIERTLRRAEFEPVARAAELGPTIEAAFAFVRDRVRVDLYRGWMKGAAGTLSTRSGSALDRCMLLAALLAKHGFKTRFATGKLASERARALVATQLALRTAAAPATAGETSDCAPTHARYFDEVSAVLARVERDTRQLAEVLQAENVRVRRPVADELVELEAIAADHRWLQVEQGGAWVDLDPAFPDAVPGRAFAPVTSTAGEPSADEAHALTFRLRLSRRSDGKIEELTLVEGAGTAADLRGQVVRLSVIPDTDPPALAQADLRAATGFLAVLTVAGKTSQRTFAANGQTERAPGPPRTGVFSTSGLFGGLDEAIEASGGKTGRSLDRVWLEIAMREPGRADRVHVRNLYVRASDKTDVAAGGTVALALCRDLRMLVEVGPESPERIAGLTAGWLKDNAAALDKAATDPRAKAGEESRRGLDEGLELHALAQIIWVAGEQIAFQDFGGARFYRARPAIYAFRAGYEPVDKTTARYLTGYDIVESTWATWHPTAPDRAAALAMSLGVLQTHLERFYGSKILERLAAALALVTPADPVPVPVVGLPDVLEAAASRGVGLQVAQDSSALEGHPATAAALAVARERIDRGHVLLMLAAPVPVSGRDRWGFWQVETNSGNALGVLETGEGQTTVFERLILLPMVRVWLFLDNHAVAIRVGLTVACLTGFAYALASSTGVIQGNDTLDKASAAACILLEGFYNAGLGSSGGSGKPGKPRGAQAPPDPDGPGTPPTRRPAGTATSPVRDPDGPGTPAQPLPGPTLLGRKPAADVLASDAHALTGKTPKGHWKNPPQPAEVAQPGAPRGSRKFVADSNVFADMPGQDSSRRRMDGILANDANELVVPGSIRGEVTGPRDKFGTQEPRLTATGGAVRTPVPDPPGIDTLAKSTGADGRAMVGGAFSKNDLALLETALQNDAPIVTRNFRLIEQVRGGSAPRIRAERYKNVKIHYIGD